MTNFSNGFTPTESTGARFGSALGKGIGEALEALARQKTAEQAHQREMAAQRELLELMHQQKLQEIAYQQQLQQEEIARQERLRQEEIAHQERLQQEERAYRQQIHLEQAQIQRQSTNNDLLGLTFLALGAIVAIWMKTKQK